MRVMRQFTEEVKHRQAEREHTISLTHGQRYVLRELRVLFGAAADEDAKGQINILEKAFRGPITTAINRELNLLRRNSVIGQDLLKNLARLFHQHNMRDWMDRRGLQFEEMPTPRIVCSEALVSIRPSGNLPNTPPEPDGDSGFELVPCSNSVQSNVQPERGGMPRCSADLEVGRCRTHEQWQVTSDEWGADKSEVRRTVTSDEQPRPESEVRTSQGQR